MTGDFLSFICFPEAIVLALQRCGVVLQNYVSRPRFPLKSPNVKPTPWTKQGMSDGYWGAGGKVDQRTSLPGCSHAPVESGARREPANVEALWHDGTSRWKVLRHRHDIVDILANTSKIDQAF